MKIPRSKIGLTFSCLYLFVSIFLIATQGFFGESFIAIFLGWPWSFLLVYFDIVMTQRDPLFTLPLSLHVQVLGPILLNVIFLYWIGAGTEKLFCHRRKT